MIESIIQYFSTIPSLHRALILAGGISFFWLAESAIPLFRFSYHKWKHAGVNLFFTATTIVVNFALAFLLVKAGDYVVQNKFGLLYIFPLPNWLFLLAGLLLLDLVGAWLVHYVEHKVKWMWKFHMVHHADTHVDTTTANRHHPGESFFRFIFTLAGVLLLGTPVWLVMIYQSCSVVLTQFNHANIRLPEKLDQVISWVLVSPNMHKVHHHYMRPETDTNYGNIFSVWDRLFGTYHYTPVDQLKYGLDVLDDTTDENMGFQLGIPFNKNIKTDR
ncbi:MAG: sterol desaturase family protein [Sediminibacterium sp.]|jgi:sterol desaturase/sphingolipid hydroxylase (fatty acid hydroxylase superfamily)